MESALSSCALEIHGLSKTFGATRALIDVALSVQAGEVHALLGHNGSGKSTLIKILAGVHRPDFPVSASAFDNEFSAGDPGGASRAGLRFVHQDLGIVPEFDAVDNIALTVGYSRTTMGRVAVQRQAQRTQELLLRFGVVADVHRPLKQASAVERTIVAIARALWDADQGPRVLVLDEPTAALPSKEVEYLFDVLREIQAEGHGILYVSHRMDEIFDIATRVTVLRAGEVVGQGVAVAEQTRRGLAALIAGHVVEEHARSSASADVKSPPRLSVRGLAGTDVGGVSFEVRPGEVLGVAGLVGSGRDELPYLLTGAAEGMVADSIAVDGEPCDLSSVAAARGSGIEFLPSDRKREGLIADFTVAENLTLTSLENLSDRGRLSRRSLRKAALPWLEKMGVVPLGPDLRTPSLSGGNQQKVLLGRCLSAQPRVLVMSEPTAGVDVGARQQIYQLIEQQVRAGLAVILASSDTEDLLSLCDRILVMQKGEVVTIVDGPSATVSQLLHLMEDQEIVDETGVS